MCGGYKQPAITNMRRTKKYVEAIFFIVMAGKNNVVNNNTQFSSR